MRIVEGALTVDVWGASDHATPDCRAASKNIGGRIIEDHDGS